MAAVRIKLSFEDGSAIYVADFKSGKPDGAPVWMAVMNPGEAEVFTPEQAEDVVKEIVHWYRTVGKDIKEEQPDIKVEAVKMRLMNIEEVREAAAELCEKIGFDACEDSVLYCRIADSIREMSLFIADKSN